MAIKPPRRRGLSRQLELIYTLTERSANTMKNIVLELTPAQVAFLETALHEQIGKQLASASRARSQGSMAFAKMVESKAEVGKGLLKELKKATTTV